jgi:hypothetical protein
MKILLFLWNQFRKKLLFDTMRNSYVKHVRLSSSSKSQEPLYFVLYSNFYAGFSGFCVCDETNTVKCLVTKKTTFYIMEPTKKKKSLKHSFCEAVFICFFN